MLLTQAGGNDLRLGDLVRDKEHQEVGIITDYWVGEFGEANVIVSFLETGIQEVYWHQTGIDKLQLITEKLLD